jgi:hypothetical protein
VQVRTGPREPRELARRGVAEHVTSLLGRPQFDEPTDDRQRRVGGDERTVHRPDRRSHDDFRLDLGLEQGSDHADFDGAEHAAATEYECDRTIRHRIILAPA